MHSLLRSVRRWLAQTAGPRVKKAKANSSSISDTAVYREVCAEAAKNPEAFRVFRSHPAYTKVLEHVSVDQGNAYLEIVKTDRVVAQFVDENAPFSLRGGPQTADFGLSQEISPTLLRYAKVLVDLRNLFGSLDNFKIVEVGVGYGGQCQVICGAQSIREYALIDLPEALQLAERWLEPYQKANSVQYIDTLGKHPSCESDLFISNYALSEINRPEQEQIIAAYASTARRGYVTYNHIGRDRDIMPATEFAEVVKGEVLPEYPLTHKDNCIVVWGNNID